MWASRREGKGFEVFDLQDRITQVAHFEL